MRVTFGTNLDGPAHPDLLDGRDACQGVLRVGPLGMLDLLETHLGLGGAGTSDAVRVAQYRLRLAAADEGRRFYSRSFEADPVGVARTLYRWREELILSGWSGAASKEAPLRLRDLAAVEVAAAEPALDPGFAERLRAVSAALAIRCASAAQRSGAVRVVPIRELCLVEEAAELPVLWRRVIELLEEGGVAVTRFAHRDASAAGDLGLLQAALVGSRKPAAASGDGSLLVLTARSELEAAEAIARWLAAQAGGAVVVNASSDPALDDAMRRLGLAAAGTSESSRFRPALQVLPLALAMHWDPVDPARVLEFLTLPVSPLPRHAARRLATAVAESPGIGGAKWRKVLEAIHKTAPDEVGPAPASAAEAKARREVAELEELIRTWIQPQRYRPVDGIPPEVVAATCARVAQWLGARHAHSDDDPVLGAAMAAASEAGRLADHESAPLAPADLHRLVNSATRAGSAPPKVGAEVGHVATLRSPDALLGPASTIVWWDFTEASDSNPPVSPWTAAERTAFAREGIDLPDLATERLRQTRRQLRPVFAASERLVLVAPERRRGQAVTVHSLWDRIAAVFGDSSANLKASIADGLARGRLAGIGAVESVRVARRPLPRPKRWWKLRSGKLLVSRETESYTGLTDFVNHPFKWVLKYGAKLYPGFTAGLTDGNQLYGTLAHRLIGEVVSEPSLASAGEPAVRSFLESRIDTVLAEEGAVLLQPGRRSDRSRLLHRSVQGATTLLRLLREGGWILLGVEVPLEGKFAGGNLKGWLDVALKGKGSRRAVVDMKWGGRKYHLESLEENTALQLALYGHLLRETGGAWPSAAYLVLDPPALLGDDGGAFPGAHVPNARAGSTADLWATVEALWRWRRKQLDRGKIEMTDGTEPDLDSAPPDGCWLTEDECNFNDYRSLVGFSTGEQP